MEVLEIGVKMREVVFFMTRRCFRSVCDHPFLVVILCFLIFLYRSFPFIFSLLVATSPVLVCTVVLLGTLLSFGQPNIPEIEREEKTTHEVVSVKMGISRDATVIEKNESYYVERYSEKRRDEGEQVREHGDVHREGSLDDTMPLIDERSPEIKIENGEIREATREFGVNEERLSDEEVEENRYASFPEMNNGENPESDYEKSEADSFDSERVNVDSLDSPPRSPWKRVDDRKEEEEEANDALESESDKAESSSPDASMADIMPMLDELHPLLDEETPQPDHMSHEGSDAESEVSPKSSISSDESDDGTEINRDLEVADEDNEDGEDEDDAQGDEKEQMKSVITWTEEDQKNLMDLGSSEIERNQRLENLILRRRARKNTSMMPERNLIDLECFDLGFNIAPISTARKNPFDIPRDCYDNLGLPPIPGSAPSILLPRRNPFDIPYDSSEEKPDLMGDGFQEEFSTVQSREPFFRRHESFHAGASIFASTKQERQNAKLRPYFVPEQMVSEESSYSPFQRQSSELSDSKVSSVPETESIGSVEDTEERGLSEEDNPPESESFIGTKEATKESSSGDPEPISKMEDIPEEYMPREPELILSMEHVSEQVGHGSQSSEEDEQLLLGRIEKRDVEQDEHELRLEDAEDHYEDTGVAKSLEVLVTGYHPNYKTVKQIHSRGSRSLSLSEVSESVFNETEGEPLSILEGRSDGFAENPGISTQTSVGSDFSITLVEGMALRDPIYDLSPPAARKNFLSSMSSDEHIETDLGLPPELVKQMVSSTERESEGSNLEMDVHSNTVMSPKSSTPHSVTEHESRQMDMVEIREHDGIIFDPPRVEQRLSSSVEHSVEESLKGHHTQGQLPSSSSDKHIHDAVECSKDEGPLEEEKHLLISEIRRVEICTPLMVGQLTADHSIADEETAESPKPAVRKEFSSLMASDVHIESDLGLPPELVKKMVSLAETESEGSSVEMEVPSNVEMLPNSSTTHSVIGDESRQIDMVKIRENDDVIDFPGVEQRSSSSVEASAEENLKDYHTQGQVPSSSSDKNIHGAVECSKDEGQLEEEKHLLISEIPVVEICTPVMVGQLTADHSITKEETSESPKPAVRKEFSYLVPFDMHVESDLGLPPELVKKMVPLAETESEGNSLETDVPINVEMLPESSMIHSVIEHESGYIGMFKIRSKNDDVIFDSPRVEQRSISSVEASVLENLKDHHTPGQVASSIPDKSTRGMVECSEDKSQLEEENHLLVSEKHTVRIPMLLIEGRVTADPSIAEEGTAQSPNSDGDVNHEANEKLITIPSAEGNVSLFYGRTIHERIFEYLNEVQVPNTPVGPLEERKTIQILNIHELGHNISENLNSPLSPDFISTPSMSSGQASPHVEMHTIIQEDDEIKDIDEELLSELDSVGDFSVKKWRPSSNEFEKHEIVSPAHPAETSTSRVVEVNSFEMSEIENAIRSENSKEEIDVHEAIESVSEPQTQTPDQEMTKENTIFACEDMIFGISQEVRVSKEADLLIKKDGSTSLETEAAKGGAKASSPVGIHTTSGMPELQAITTEDFGFMFKETNDKEIEKFLVVEPPHSEMVIGETIGERWTLHDKTGFTHGVPVIEIRPLEDASVEEIRSVYTITDHKVEVCKDVHSSESIKGKGKISKSSSSSSSSSSESSSSDSDRE